MDDRATALRLMSVSHETLQRLDLFVGLLAKWQARTNLIAPSTLPQVWTRHIADSFQLLPLAPNARRWLDIGSGSGCPGIVIACALANVSSAHVDLVERNVKKAAFLREALRVTEAAGTVHCADVSDCADALAPDIEVVTARAVAPLSDLLLMARPWLMNGSVGLFPKGQDVERELADETIYGMFKIRKHASQTGDGWIIEVTRRDRSESAPSKAGMS